MDEAPDIDPPIHATHPVVGTELTFGSVTDKISAIVLKRKTPIGWFIGFAISFALFQLLLLTITNLVFNGIGLWGINQPVGWGFAIINFVWWIGIGHAGTLISAILLLLRQKWRTSINRFAEAMTLFAVAQAGLYPIMHLGRPWLAYWLFPYPNTMGIWPQFRSPLMWDVFAVSTYATVSFVFWFIGLIPDLATLRDRSTSRVGRFTYGLLAMGWRGSATHWHRYETAYLLLAGLSTPLVLSVHTIVSFDFAVSLIPGWHTTIFPPYFVAGAVFSGFAMVMSWMVPARHFLGLKHVITMRHLENMNKIILATGMLVGYGYLMEHFIAWYSGNQFEWFVFFNRATGPYRGVYYLMLFCNVLTPQIFWFKWARTNIPVMFIASIFVNIGMWCERFVIIVTSLHRDFLPASGDIFYPTWVDITLFLGTIGFFSTCFLLFLKFIPAVAVSEVKELNEELQHRPAPVTVVTGA